MREEIHQPVVIGTKCKVSWLTGCAWKMNRSNKIRVGNNISILAGHLSSQRNI